MNDLSNTTFIIPLKIESEDRMRNIITVLCFLLKNFNSKVIVKEVDSQKVFETEVLGQIAEFLEDKIDNLLHIFEYSEDPVFHRTKILNQMINLTTTDVVVNYDCDVLLKLESYIKSVERITDEGYDLIYPYGVGHYQQQVFATDEIVSDFISDDFNFDILLKNSRNHTSDRGWVQFFKRSSYIRGGMENENFIGSAPEDLERYDRYVKLGYKVGRIDDLIFHLEHSRGMNSFPISMQQNPNWNNNWNLYQYLSNISVEELKKYYKNQNYLKKYDNCILPS
jgi:hypothetical protein